ncbi:hypothetical protein DFH27DRAFT_214426 [Peziza echinospora]|nr:hypothetical protein DFH27DRAFT_214426 [Peziza echinospora]
MMDVLVAVVADVAVITVLWVGSKGNGRSEPGVLGLNFFLLFSFSFWYILFFFAWFHIHLLFILRWGLNISVCVCVYMLYICSLSLFLYFSLSPIDIISYLSLATTSYIFPLSYSPFFFFFLQLFWPRVRIDYIGCTRGGNSWTGARLRFC